MEKSGFVSEETYHLAILPERSRSKLEREEKEYESQCLRQQSEQKLLEKQVSGKTYTDTTELNEQLKAEKQALKEAEKTYMELHTAYENDRSVLQNCAVYLEKGKKLESEDQVIKSLSKTANGRLSGSAKIDFETYIQRQYFKQIIHEANKRLLTMSNHQFILKLKEEAKKDKRGTGSFCLQSCDGQRARRENFVRRGIFSGSACDGTWIVRYRGAERRGDPPGYDVYR